MRNQNNSQALIIERIFQAPRAKVWKAWTDPEQMKRWWGPKDFTAPFVELDLRVGGKYLYCMRSPEGKDYWGTGIYREIVPLEKIVATDSFADDKGNVVPAAKYGMTGDWPLELTVTVTLEDQDNKTKMTLIHVGLPAGESRDLCREGGSSLSISSRKFCNKRKRGKTLELITTGEQADTDENCL